MFFVLCFEFVDEVGVEIEYGYFGFFGDFVIDFVVLF